MIRRRRVGLPEGPLADDQRAHPDDDEGPVPVFGTWRRIYVAVLLNLLLMMGLLLLFSRWPY
jgi:hypothetical protein